MWFRWSLEALLVLLLLLQLAHGWLIPNSRSGPCNKINDMNRFANVFCRKSTKSPLHLRATSPSAEASNTAPFTQADIIWRIRLPPGTPLVEQMKWSLQAKKALLNANIKKQPLPRLWLPTDQKQIVIEAWYNDSKIARFGITIQPGPPAPAIVETIETIYGETDQSVMNCAAIIFMFVEPDYRARNLGTLALELISYIHATQGADYTVLVADDKDNGKLVKWYQAHGYSLAPKLQDFFGSPNQIYGITMIGPTNYELSDDCNIEW